MIDAKVADRLLKETSLLVESLTGPMGYWIDSGTLLGAVRDRSINIYDHDIDVRILPGRLPEKKMKRLVLGLWEIGFRAIVQNWGKRAELICVHPDKVMLDLKFAFEDGNLLWVYCWPQPASLDTPRVHCYPIRFFENLGVMNFLGREYPVPMPVEEYLEFHYGPQWREFKKRPEQAEETDLSWDYMMSPPCAMSLEQLAAKREEFGSTQEPSSLETK